MKTNGLKSRATCGIVRDLLVGGELNYLHDFEAKELAQTLPSDPGGDGEPPGGIRYQPELDLQRDLDDGAEGLRRGVDFDVPVVLARGKGSSAGKLPQELQQRFPKRITFAYGERG